MKIRIKTFAVIRDICGFDEKEVVIADGVTVGDVFTRLAESFVDLAAHGDRVLFAVNEEYCGRERTLSEGEILAIFPPVSGG